MKERLQLIENRTTPKNVLPFQQVCLYRNLAFFFKVPLYRLEIVIIFVILRQTFDIQVASRRVASRRLSNLAYK